MNQNFESAVRTAALNIRDQLRQDETLPHFDFKISISGRVQDGEIKIEFSLDGDYSDQRSKGDSIQAVIDEFLRRRDWNTQHKPLSIGGPRVPNQENEEVNAS